MYDTTPTNKPQTQTQKPKKPNAKHSYQAGRIMFRRLANRVNNAVSNATSSLNPDNSANATANDSRVSELAAMGFREAEARHALRVANGDMQQATEWLLSHGSPVGTAGNPIAIPEAARSATHEDSEMQRAIQASLLTETQTQNRNKNKNHGQQQQQQHKQATLRSAASKHAGRAAASRHTNKTTGGGVPKKGLATTHPKVQMPKRLSQHDQEDIIMRCANRIAPYSLSVDTLLRSLKTIQGNPSNRKFHTVDTSTASFQRSLHAPGVLDFLKAVNFHANYNNHKILTLSHFDAAAFYLGISALEQIQQNSTDYTKDKALRVFQKDLAFALSEKNITAEELSARTKFLSKLPSEPTKGGSQITIEYGVVLSNLVNANFNNVNTKNNTNNTSATASSEQQLSLTKITRGFDHDDTLGDVLQWLGGQATEIPQKLETGEWKLVDRNRQGPEEDYNFHKLNVNELRDRTLQYVGCWPSGRLAIVPKITN